MTLADVDEPYPLHAYDTTVVGLLSAFYPARKAGFSSGIYVSSSPVFDLRDFELDDMHLDFKVGNYVAKDAAGKASPAPPTRSPPGSTTSTPRASSTWTRPTRWCPSSTSRCRTPTARGPA